MTESSQHPWIDGIPQPGHGVPLDVISPSSGEVFATVSTPNPQEIEEACALALAAHLDGRWRRLPPLERQRIMMHVGSLIREQDQVLARGIAEEMGMPLGAARFIEVPFAAATFEYFGGLIPQIHGETLPMDIPGAPPEYLTYTLRQPIGVCGLITPWNFPLLLPSWKIAAALAAGCTVILKPAPESPLTALRLAEILQEAGIPPGIVTVLPGNDMVGAALVRHPSVAKISFTGDTSTGQAILEGAAPGLKRVSLELGGKSPVVVCQDFNVDQAVSQCLFGIFFNAGQVCQATSRIYVHESLYEPFLDQFVERTRQLRVGMATDPAIDVGPVVRADRLAMMDAVVQESIQAGARVLVGGHSLPGPGYWYEPTVVADADRQMTVMQQELFGPIAAVQPFATEHDVLTEMNASRYGLAASVLTHDVRRALRMARDIEAGTVWVNTVQVLSPTAPFGGVKASGMGKELGMEGLQEYLTTKTVIVDLNEDPMTYY
jgi:aldehyde dehydrogenase (NAD+)